MFPLTKRWVPTLILGSFKRRLFLKSTLLKGEAKRNAKPGFSHVIIESKTRRVRREKKEKYRS